MGYIIFTLGTSGDVLPFLRIAAELINRGKQVMFLGNEKFRQLALAYGVSNYHAVSTIEQYEKTYLDHKTWTIHQSKDHYRTYHFPAIEPVYKKIKEVVATGEKPFLLFQDIGSGAKMACDEFDLNYCLIVLAPSALYSAESPSFPLRIQIQQEDWHRAVPLLKEKARTTTFNTFVAPMINPLRIEMGLTPLDKNMIAEPEQAKNLIGLFPEWLKPRPTDWPYNLHLINFLVDTPGLSHSNQNEKANNFIEKNGSPIVFTFGTGVPLTKSILKKVAQISSLLSIPGILVGNPREIEADKYDNILIIPFIEFSELFPKARLVIHHGGIGTCAEALASGVPQLISPFAFDQPDNAYLFWQLGVANAVDFIKLTAEEIALQAKELIDSSLVSEKCNQYKNIRQTNSVNFSVDLIEKMSSN